MRLTHKLSNQLYLFQFPVQNGPFKYSPVGARIKPTSKFVQLDIPIAQPGSANYDVQRGEEIAKHSREAADQSRKVKKEGSTSCEQITPPPDDYFKCMTLSSAMVPHHANYMIGTFKDGMEEP